MFGLAAIPAMLRTALLAGVAALVLGLGGWGLWQRHSASLAWQEAAQAVATEALQQRATAERDAALAEQQRQHQAELAGLEQQHAAALAAAQAAAQTERVIYAAPVTTACTASPAIRGLLDSLRSAAPGGAAAGGAAGAPADTGRAAGLPAGATAAAPRR